MLLLWRERFFDPSSGGKPSQISGGDMSSFIQAGAVQPMQLDSSMYTPDLSLGFGG